jgi:hypothetical protein
MTQKQKKAVSPEPKAASPRTRTRKIPKVLSENELQEKAYSLWESRGRPMGSPEVDWYDAKEKLSPQKSS